MGAEINFWYRFCKTSIKHSRSRRDNTGTLPEPCSGRSNQVTTSDSDNNSYICVL